LVRTEASVLHNVAAKDNVGCETGHKYLQLHCSICPEITKYDGRNREQIIELWLSPDR